MLAGLTPCLILTSACSGNSAGRSPTRPAKSSNTTSTSTSQLIADVRRNALAQGSVVTVAHFSRGRMSQTFRDSVAVDHGRQVITFGEIHAEVLLAHGRAFITGNGVAMVRYFGLPAHLKSQLAGHWVELTPQDSGYRNVTTNLTLSSEIDGLLPVAPLTQGNATFQGRNVIAIHGAVPPGQGAPTGARVTLYVSTGPRALPVAEVGGYKGITESIVLAHWGQPVNVASPAGATPISQVQ